MTRRGAPGLGLPEVADAIAVELGAGRSLPQALAASLARAEPVLAGELAGAVARIERGVAASAALDEWAAASSVDGARLLAAAVGLAARAGGDGAHAVRGVAATVRERRALDREVRALAAQARLSAAVVALAPLAFAVTTAGVDGPTAQFLLASPAGWGCLLVGVVLDVGGWCWMQQITRSVR